MNEFKWMIAGIGTYSLMAAVLKQHGIFTGITDDLIIGSAFTGFFIIISFFD